MNRAARSVYLTALGLWVGGMATLFAVVAPTVFDKAPSRAVAGTIFGAILRGFGPVQIVLGILAIAAVALLIKGGDVPLRGGLLRLAALLVMLLVALNAQFILGPAIERERAAVVNFDSMPPGVPGRARFDSLHKWSVRLGSLSLLTGLGLLAASAAVKKPADGA